MDDLAKLDPDSGLARLFPRWRQTGSLDKALRAGYGVTLDAFELEWRRRTRRRYGALALFGDFTLVGVLLILIVAPLYIARRGRNRQRMAALVAADVAADAAERQSTLEVLLGGEGSGPEGAEGKGTGHEPGVGGITQTPDK